MPARVCPNGTQPLGIGLTGMTPEDLSALRRAVRSLEHPGLAARLTNMVGKPIELIGDVFPASASRAIATATFGGLETALKVALRTMQHTPHAGSQLLHKALATASGAAGGAFGLTTLPIELPVSTIIMLRSIADIARSQGEDLSDPESALSCVQVFALGGRAGSADASQSGYFAVRGMLAKSVTEAARFIASAVLSRKAAQFSFDLATRTSEPLAPMPAEFGAPLWKLGASTYACAVCAYSTTGIDQLAVLDLRSGVLQLLETPFTEFNSVRADNKHAVCRAGAPNHPASIVMFDLASGAHRILKKETDLLDRSELRIADYLSMVKSVEFPTTDGSSAYGLFYPPQNPDYAGPANELPPLLVKCHGGPTASASSALDLNYAILDEPRDCGARCQPPR
jgi:hypothetical protein